MITIVHIANERSTELFSKIFLAELKMIGCFTIIE